MERLISIVVALVVLVFFVFWVTSEEPLPLVEEPEPVVEEEVLDAVEVPPIEEEKKDETATLKSLFKQEEVVQDPLLNKFNTELADLALKAGQYVVGVIAIRNKDEVIAEHEDIKWLGLDDLPEESCVSGTVLSQEGYIVTTFRAIAGAHTIKVSVARGLMKEAALIGADPYANIAVLKVETEPLVEVPWGDAVSVRRGEVVMCVASGEGFRKSFLSGVVSDKQRDGILADGLSYENFIQLDLPQIFGSDGAPVINVKGEVVGVYSEVKIHQATKSGFAYAIPSNLVRFVTDSILNKGVVVRGGIGVRVQAIDDHIATAFAYSSVEGALVSDVFTGGSADIAGVAAGDMIVKVGEIKVDSAMQLRLQIAQAPVGSMMPIEIFRSGQFVPLEVLIEQRLPPAWVSGLIRPKARYSTEHSQKEEVNKVILQGLKVEELTSTLIKKYEYPADSKGLIITEVMEESPAEKAGLKKGMQILSVNHQYVHSIEEWETVLEDSEFHETILLWIEWNTERKYYILH